MNIDPKWLSDYARRAGIVGPWERHGDVWIRRWVRRRDLEAVAVARYHALR